MFLSLSSFLSLSECKSNVFQIKKKEQKQKTRQVTKAGAELRLTHGCGKTRDDETRSAHGYPVTRRPQGFTGPQGGSA